METGYSICKMEVMIRLHRVAVGIGLGEPLQTEEYHINVGWVDQTYILPNYRWGCWGSEDFSDWVEVKQTSSSLGTNPHFPTIHFHSLRCVLSHFSYPLWGTTAWQWTARGFWSQTNLGSNLPRSGTLSQLLNLSKPQFSPVKYGELIAPSPSHEGIRHDNAGKACSSRGKHSRNETVYNYFCFHRKPKWRQLNLGGGQALLKENPWNIQTQPSLPLCGGWDSGGGGGADPSALDKSCASCTPRGGMLMILCQGHMMLTHTLPFAKRILLR